MLYLSHDIPWMDKLESVYLFIWQQIHSLKESDNEIDDDVERIEEAVLRDLYGMITEKDIANIDVNLQSEERDRDRKEIWSRLVKCEDYRRTRQTVVRIPRRNGSK
ncbi:Protein translocase subunit secA [Anopheles sinensis]|uniref:Protein translocase subunit secA n=1 Tax=Anopheles sinensis TaxID=74873 RepID=A0A084WUZ3_ANOSI|nr:Protein translocase subunit secA [Anopheles sinensis]